MTYNKNMTYKYGTTILLKVITKDRIQARGKMNDSFDTIVTEMLGKVELFEKIYAIKENKKILDRMIGELPETKQKTVDAMRDEQGRSKIPLEVGIKQNDG